MKLSDSIKVRLREGQALVYAAEAKSRALASQLSSATASTKRTGFGIQTAPAGALVAAALLLGTAPDAAVTGIDPERYSPTRF